ncbi:pyruvate ferredoxin oxidoreductase, gamma subunit [Syntrophus gentianae]|uniref:Pyruvate ferredoxin oxidoreductase, gamma subunit n=1 Tax=Syntrophus gentianae TaxID=43775 RepID=A0A1H7VA63_9BACT|nr:2-oxoacid:acceptor oxidoreductase family protein [Syntrophus gentianae]SEM06163.1 pyruvate ferredoxin oxidoreductase, gamma subunit [Syntrophus gentianae]
MFEIRIHSRGGQGGVTASRLVALAAIHDGKDATACVFYGPQRRGAPVISFVRIDDSPIRIYSHIQEPDLVVVLDPSVMETIDVFQRLKKGGRIFFNSTQAKDFPGFYTLHADLTGIARRENLILAGYTILNTPLLGILAKMGILSLNSAKKAIEEMFPDPRNIRAAEAAYREMSL